MTYKALQGLPWPSAPPVTVLTHPAHPLHSSCSGLYAVSHSCQACSLCLNALSKVVYKAPSHTPAGFLPHVALWVRPCTLFNTASPPQWRSPFPSPDVFFCHWSPRDSVSTWFIVLLILGWCRLHGGRDFCQFCAQSRILFGP